MTSPEHIRMCTTPDSDGRAMNWSRGSHGRHFSAHLVAASIWWFIRVTGTNKVTQNCQSYYRDLQSFAWYEILHLAPHCDLDGGRTVKQILLYLCQLNKTIEQKHNCTSNFSSNFWLDKWPIEPESIEPIYIKQIKLDKFLIGQLVNWTLYNWTWVYWTNMGIQ